MAAIQGDSLAKLYIYFLSQRPGYRPCRVPLNPIDFTILAGKMSCANNFLEMSLQRLLSFASFNKPFAKKRRSLGRHSSLADQSHGVFFSWEKSE
jgi:hypothetical protein